MKDIEVSVLCITYNHEKYIERCLDNILNQKTNFKFEIIIHDDASTDNTASIIKKYAEKFSDIIIPILQTENQYSKGVDITDEIMYPLAKGKYIAVCEGDDYWCDENKLQLQYDFMENNVDCSACFHNTKIFNSIKKSSSFENNWKDIHYLTPKEIFSMGKVHTSSFFVRKQFFLKPSYGKNVWIGDFVKRTTFFKYGKLVVLPQVMSVYYINNGDGSVTNYFFNVANIEFINKKTDDVIKYLYEYKKENLKYENIINNLIDNFSFCKVYNLNMSRMIETENKVDFIESRKNIKRDSYYKRYIKKLNTIKKIKFLIKFNIPFRMFKKIMKNKRGIIWVE